MLRKIDKKTPLRRPKEREREIPLQISLYQVRPATKIRSHQRYVEKIKDKHPMPKETQKHKSHELL